MDAGGGPADAQSESPKSRFTRQDSASRGVEPAGDNPVDNVFAELPLVLFDADCGFCTKSAQVMVGPWVNAQVRAVPFQQVDLAIHNLTVDNCSETLHVVSGDRVDTGSAAIAAVLRAGRFPWPLVGGFIGLPGVRWLAQRCYELVARNRHSLPGGTAACRLPD